MKTQEDRHRHDVALFRYGLNAEIMALAVQLRFRTTLTADESVGRETCRNASFPACLKDRCRFDCRECRTTISLLPDFAAARRRGSLRETEDDMVGLAGSLSRWVAARHLNPYRDELSPVRAAADS